MPYMQFAAGHIPQVSHRSLSFFCDVATELLTISSLLGILDTSCVLLKRLNYDIMINYTAGRDSELKKKDLQIVMMVGFKIVWR